MTAESPQPTPASPADRVLEGLSRSVISGDCERAERLTRDGLAAGLSPIGLLRQGLMSGMAVVGERFRREEMFLPEVVMSARAMKAGLTVVRPLLTANQARGLGRVVLGTVQGDVHDIGRHIIGMVLEGAGYEVIDVGCDVKPTRFVELVHELQPQVLGMSALLTSTMPYMKVTVDALRKAGLAEQVIIGVGGASVTQAFADKIAADFYGQNATDALEKVNRMLAVRATATPGQPGDAPSPSGSPAIT